MAREPKKPEQCVAVIYIAPAAGAPMQRVKEVLAIAGEGLQGDRYARGEGSWSKGRKGARQVTFMNARFFRGSGFTFPDARRNIFTRNVELNSLVGKEFWAGGAKFRGVKYCEPCPRPSKLSGNRRNFARVFQDCGGIVAEVLVTGYVRDGDAIAIGKK